VVNACGPVSAGQVRCFAQVRTDVHAGKGVRGQAARAAAGKATTLPPGYGPADLASAYQLPSTGGGGQTVAVVDAGDDPTAEADLAVYRATYGLPACTTANGCFRKVNQAGAASPLPPDLGWDVEIALDLDMVSASCPKCHVLLVEGDAPTFAGLGAAENTAVALGAGEVSNSYGGTEQNGMQAYAADYSHAGVAIVASSGDEGYGIPNFPAVLSTVIAVGGTTLTKASNTRGWSETAWGGATSGCSAWIDKPSWQHDPNCPGRMIADVAADADPYTGPAVYDTDSGAPGWLVVGGTSAASPFIAGVIALAGNPGVFPNASYLYSHAASLYDVVGGNNSIQTDCGGDYQCNAVPGYDGPTGNGTPNGLGAF
jgi:subtilase family serine protease